MVLELQRDKCFVNQVTIIMQGTNPKILVLFKTRIPNNWSSTILNSLSYDMHEISEGDGFFRGIWMGWKSTMIAFKIKKKKLSKIYMQRLILVMAKASCSLLFMLTQPMI